MKEELEQVQLLSHDLVARCSNMQNEMISVPLSAFYSLKNPYREIAEGFLDKP